MSTFFKLYLSFEIKHFVTALNHENVVKIKAVLADDGIIIMEFIREGSLDRYVHAHKDQLRLGCTLLIDLKGARTVQDSSSLDGKLMRLGVRHPIIDDSDSKPANFDLFLNKFVHLRSFFD